MAKHGPGWVFAIGCGAGGRCPCERLTRGRTRLALKPASGLRIDRLLTEYCRSGHHEPEASRAAMAEPAGRIADGYCPPQDGAREEVDGRCPSQDMALGLKTGTRITASTVILGGASLLILAMPGAGMILSQFVDQFTCLLRVAPLACPRTLVSGRGGHLSAMDLNLLDAGRQSRPAAGPIFSRVRQSHVDRWRVREGSARHVMDVSR